MVERFPRSTFRSSPLNMGLKGQSNALQVEVDAEGRIKYDVVLRPRRLSRQSNSPPADGLDTRRRMRDIRNDREIETYSARLKRSGHNSRAREGPFEL